MEWVQYPVFVSKHGGPVISGMRASPYVLLVSLALVGPLFVGLADANQGETVPLVGDEDGQAVAAAVRLSDDETVRIFTETLRRYQRIQFDELVTGDASLFPTIFYNDPKYPVQGDDWQQTIAWAGADAIDAVISSGAPGPVGAESGFLSAKVAEHIVIWENIAAWEAVEATAAAEGRAPTGEEVNSLPHGLFPYPRKSAGDWAQVPYHVFDIVIEGNHATAKLAYIEPTDVIEDYGDVYQIVWFTWVEGQWYISQMQSVVCPCTDTPPVQP